MDVAEQLYLIEARRVRRGDQPAGIARFIVSGRSRYAALSKLRVHYDTSDIDSLTATPVSDIIPIAGALVHDMRRPSPEPGKLREPGAPQARDGADDDEPWKRSA
jgi:hypothetical protein